MPRVTAPLPQRADRDRGFTLVEVMIVVFIVALMSAVVVVNLPKSKPATLIRSDELVRDLNRAAREAIVSGEPIALATHQGRYRFDRYRAGFWSPAGAVSAGRAAARGAVTVEVIRDDAPAKAEPPPRRSTDAAESADPFQRKLVFSPVGDATPARIIITGDGQRAVLRVTAAGDVTRSTDSGVGRRGEGR